LTGQHRVGELLPTQFFDALEKLVVVVGIVMREGQLLHAGHFRNLAWRDSKLLCPHPRRFCNSSAVYCASLPNKSAPRANSTSRPIDLLAMLDISMPGLNGIELCCSFKRGLVCP
jgi:hypothetical protein